MSGKSKKEYLIKIRERYRKAPKKEKIQLLDEVCLVCSFNRKYAIRVLSHKKANWQPEKAWAKKTIRSPGYFKSHPFYMAQNKPALF